MGLRLQLSWLASGMIIDVMNMVSIVEIPWIKAVWTMACMVARPFSTSYITPITNIMYTYIYLYTHMSYGSFIQFEYEMYVLLLKCSTSIVVDAKNRMSHSRFINFYSTSMFAIKMNIRLSSGRIMTMLNHKRVK